MDTNYKKFFDLYNGKPVEVEDPTNPDQCFDLAFAWVDFLGIPRESIRHLYAYQIYTEPNDLTVKYFEFIPNTANGVPKAGDIVIFNTGVGVAGHVSIGSGRGDANTVTTFDQNWNGHKYAEEIKHPYTNIMGWLRVRQITPTTTPVSTLSFNPNNFVQIGNQTPDQIKVLIGDFGWLERQAIDGKLRDNITQITNLGSQVQTLGGSIESLTKQRDDAVAKLTDLQNKPVIEGDIDQELPAPPPPDQNAVMSALTTIAKFFAMFVPKSPPN